MMPIPGASGPAAQAAGGAQLTGGAGGEQDCPRAAMHPAFI